MRHVVTAMILVLAAGCEGIGDPWVSGPEQYAAERERSPAQHRRLIDRAERGQRDR